MILRVHRDLVDNTTGVENTNPLDPHYPGDGVDDDRDVALPAQAVRLRERADPEDSWSSVSRTWFDYHHAYKQVYDRWDADHDVDDDGIDDPAPIYEPKDLSTVLESKTHSEVTYDEITDPALPAIPNPDDFKTSYYMFLRDAQPGRSDGAPTVI